MMTPRIAIVWRGDAAAAAAGLEANKRLRPIFDAFARRGVDASPVVYRDAIADEVESLLVDMHGVLVWVDPIGGGEDRSVLDPLLCRIASRGVWVSAHPDVVAAIATKEVLFTTRDLGWSGDVHRYADVDQFRREFPQRLATDGPRVLKPRRGNGGIGIWRVELLDDGAGPMVEVHGAEARDLTVELIDLAAFMVRCGPCFAVGEVLIDQRFEPRVAEGIIRGYLVGNRVVGFARQGPGELIDQPGGARRIMGLPSPKSMFPPNEPQFAALRSSIEHEWLPAMCQLLGLEVESLPVLWDIDFLLGPRLPTGHDTYVLCEINASCVTPFPPEAVDALVDTAMGRLGVR